MCTKEDIHLIDDAIGFVKKHPEIMIGKQPWGNRIAGRLAEAAIFSHAAPLTVDHKDGWWILISVKDWIGSEDKFHRLVPFPEFHVNDCHPEILLSAFADFVITGTEAGNLRWIKGHADEIRMPDIDWPSYSRTVGRVLLFYIANEASIDGD